MSYKISYQEKALLEYKTSIEWYAERSEQAALNFQKAIEEKIDLLRLRPKSCKRSYMQFREAVLSKYPFSIVYLIDESQKLVVISSIFHHKRNPRLKFS